MLRITNRSLTRHSRNRDDTPRQLTTLPFYYTAVRKCLARENQTRTFDSRVGLLNSRTFKEMRRSPKIFCHKMAEFNDVGTHGRGSVSRNRAATRQGAVVDSQPEPATTA